MPDAGKVRTLWNILLSGRFQQAVEVVNAGDCFLAEGHYLYLAKERFADAAQVTVVADDRESGGEHEIYSDWYTLLGGMRCLINCPPGALGYFD